MPLSKAAADIAMMKKVDEMKKAKKTPEKKKLNDNEVDMYYGTKY